MKIHVSLSVASINEAIKQLEDYKNRVKRAGGEIAERLANLGYEVAWGIMAGNVYSGETISSLQVYQESENRFILQAGSTALLFFEFGAGVNGGGHPLAGEFHMGPGTYPTTNPENPHWNDPNGWWYETDDANLAIRKSKKTGKMYGHSYGNPPHMPFYQASVKMRNDLLKVAKEVMQGD